VTLLDSNGKKTRFLVQVAAELKLSNVTVVKSRVESLRNDQSQAFDQITCRAFASLTDFVAGVQALVTPQTELLAMKGAHPDAEMAALPIGFHVSQVIKLAVPGLLEARHLVIVKPGAMVTKADQHVSS
jgi:16S rRNA (guanine527-N7)-methyltransferase